MKKNYCLLMLMLVCYISPLAAKDLFIRIFDQQGRKIAKGVLTATTDSSIILLNSKKTHEIPLKDIGVIKTKRSFGHPIVMGAITGSLAGGLLGLIASGTDDSSDDSILFEPSDEEYALGGVFAGAVIGGGIGTIIAAIRKRKSIVINGDAKEWQQQRKVLDLIVASGRVK